MPQFCILFYTNYTILATQREGHGPMAPSLNTPLVAGVKTFFFIWRSPKKSCKTTTVRVLCLKIWWVTLKIDKGQVVTRSFLDREAQGSNLWQVK